MFILNVILYFSRYLARRISQTDCEMCLSGIKNQTKTSNLSAAKLVNIKSYGYLTHPDHSFFILLKQIEKTFLKLQCFVKFIKIYFTKCI